MKLADLPSLDWDAIDKRDTPLLMPEAMDIEQLKRVLAQEDSTGSGSNDFGTRLIGRGWGRFDGATVADQTIEGLVVTSAFMSWYKESHELGFHQDKKRRACVIGVEGSGQLWIAKGPLLYRDKLEERGEHLNLRRPKKNDGKPEGTLADLLPSVERLRLPINPGDLICMSAAMEKRTQWHHGGPTGKRTSFVVRF